MTSRLASLSSVFVVLALLAAGCRKTPPQPTPVAPAAPVATTSAKPDLAGKKVVMVIASKDYRDEELQEPKAILEGDGAKVTVACSSLEPARGMMGATVHPEVLLSSVRAGDCDAIVFVGGVGAEEYWNDPTAHALAKAAVAGDKVLGAICFAPVTLAKAGLLKGKRATVWSSESKQLTDAGAEYVDEPVVTDGKIITGNGPKAAEAFGEALAKALSGKA
jgi:protease I